MSDPLSESYATFPSDSDNYNYDANHSNSNDSDEPTSSDSSPMILYSPPTFWSILRGAGINLLLPFVNGLMLGFGELFAHEAAFRLGWGKTKVRWSRIDEKVSVRCGRVQEPRGGISLETVDPSTCPWGNDANEVVGLWHRFAKRHPQTNSRRLCQSNYEHKHTRRQRAS